MKKEIGLLLFLLFILSHGLYSQTESIKKESVVLKYAPLSLLDPNLTTLQFGLEYYISDKYAIQIEYGLKIPFSDSASLRPSFKGGSGFRIKTEAHYYFGSNSIFDFPFSIIEPEIGKFHNKYIGFELFYWQNNYTSYDALLDTVLNRTEEFNFKVNKRALGAALKYGFTIKVYKRLDFEIYGGIGLKYFLISNPDRNINRPNCILPRHFYEWFGPGSFPDLAKYSGLRFNMPIGFRICYTIK
jgi:hypothetical protein